MLYRKQVDVLGITSFISYKTNVFNTDEGVISKTSDCLLYSISALQLTMFNALFYLSAMQHTAFLYLIKGT